MGVPAWRIRRRPCPFYQANRCLFADNCNFLHIVQPPAPTIVVNSASPPDTSRTSIESFRSIDDDEESSSEFDDDQSESDPVADGAP